MRLLSPLISAIAFLLFAPRAGAVGREVGNGGNYVAAEFVARGYVVQSYLATRAGGGLLDEAQVKLFEVALQDARVESVTEDIRDQTGARVDARTFDDPARPGHKKIQLRQDRWLAILKSGSGIYRLVFHEYLWAIGADDTNYRISAGLHITPNSPVSTPAVRTCGRGGTVLERIGDCARPVEDGGFEEAATRLIPDAGAEDPLNQYDQPQFFTWRLVARTQDRLQIWRDERTGGLWTDADAAGVRMDSAVKACDFGADDLKAGLRNEFHLPDRRRYAEALAHGALLVWPATESPPFAVGDARLRDDPELGGHDGYRSLKIQEGRASWVALDENADFAVRCLAVTLRVAPLSP